MMNAQGARQQSGGRGANKGRYHQAMRAMTRVYQTSAAGSIKYQALMNKPIQTQKENKIAQKYQNQRLWQGVAHDSSFMGASQRRPRGKHDQRSFDSRGHFLRDIENTNKLVELAITHEQGYNSSALTANQRAPFHETMQSTPDHASAQTNPGVVFGHGSMSNVERRVKTAERQSRGSYSTGKKCAMSPQRDAHEYQKLMAERSGDKADQVVGASEAGQSAVSTNIATGGNYANRLSDNLSSPH